MVQIQLNILSNDCALCYAIRYRYIISYVVRRRIMYIERMSAVALDIFCY